MILFMELKVMIPNLHQMTATEIITWLIAYGENYTRNKRSCLEYEDNELFLTNVTRVLQQCASGRDFIQQIQDGVFDDLMQIKRASYFDALKSPRRLSYVKDISAAVLNLLERFMIDDTDADYLSGIPELDGHFVCAGDGHSIEHSVHDKKIKGKYACMTVIYAQNLRTGLIDPMEMVIDPKSSRPNEIRFLKEALPRYGEKRDCKKPLLVYDRAAVDNAFWTLGGHSWSVVTRLKTSIKPMFKEPEEFDRFDMMNEGVTGYYMIGLLNAGTMYQIDYKDPETGEKYSFITNDETLRPGTVAYLYRIRWRIEKAFDVLKNKLFEKKAWAESETSKEMQAHFIAFSYNLMLFIERFITNDIDAEMKVEAKRKKALEYRRQKAAKRKGRSVPKCELNLKHMFQISQQFVRCLRNWILARTRLNQHLDVFIERLVSYI
jgi:hypothetical protein